MPFWGLGDGFPHTSSCSSSFARCLSSKSMIITGHRPSCWNFWWPVPPDVVRGLFVAPRVLPWPRIGRGRVGRWGAVHPGDAVLCAQAGGLVLAAEARLKRRPRRPTRLLRQRIHACEQQVTQIGERLETQQQAVKRAKQRLAEAEQQVQERKLQVTELEKHYQTRKLQERPTSHLSQARQRLQAAVKRLNTRKSLCYA